MFVIAGEIGDRELAVFPELVFVAETAWLFNDRAKNVRRHRSHSRDALKLAHLPKCCANSLDFFECFLPLLNRVIKLSIEPLHHPSLFFGRKLREILLAPFG